MPEKPKSRTAYKNQFIAENYDRINLMVPKGRKKQMLDYLKTFETKLSLNAYINKLIDHDMQKDED